MASLARRLVTASDQARPGFDPIEWAEAVAPDAEWFMTPELLSSHGSEEFDALPETQRKRLSFFEAVNFFSLNIHGEKPLVAGIAERLYGPGTSEAAVYLHRFLEEENRHMAWFAGFCVRYAGKIYPEKRLALAAARTDGADDLMFFARALLFEEIVDAYNRTIGGDPRVNAVARQINRLHHKDEHRHIVFGRRLVLTLFEKGCKTWTGEQLAAIRRELEAFVDMTWRQYFNPESYRDAGIADPYGFMRRTWAHPAAADRRHRIGDEALGWMRQAGVLDGHARSDTASGAGAR